MIRISPTFGGGTKALGLVFASAAIVAGCRGGVSEEPPINLAPDMDQQASLKAQESSSVFSDHRAARSPVDGTVARGHLKADNALYRGVDADGKLVKYIPIEVTEHTLARGEERFNIYCSPCHDKTGSGNGAVPLRLQGTTDQSAFSDMPNFTLGRIADAYDGEIFQTITHGKGRMKSYATQVPEEDRWAIIAWIRVLQEIGGRTPKPGTVEPQPVQPAEGAAAPGSAAPTSAPAKKVPETQGGGSK